MKGWIVFLVSVFVVVILIGLTINETITKQTAGLIVFGISIISGFIFLIFQILDLIKFKKAVKAFKKELPEMVKAGLITEKDIDRVLNQKFPDSF